MKCFGKYRENTLGCNFCDLITKAKCYSKTKQTKETIITEERKAMIEENSIVRCIAKGLSKFTEGNAYRIISKDFEHSKGYEYGIVNDAGLIDYFDEEMIKENFTDKNVPNTITYTSYFSSIDEETKIKDNVNHPSYYTWLKDLCGIEVIDITRHMDFDLGCVLKYVLRAGKKKEMGLSDIEKEIEDLSKAKFYLNDKIAFLKNEQRNLEKSRQV